jgi:hypothetical protein
MGGRSPDLPDLGGRSHQGPEGGYYKIPIKVTSAEFMRMARCSPNSSILLKPTPVQQLTTGLLHSLSTYAGMCGALLGVDTVGTVKMCHRYLPRQLLYIVPFTVVYTLAYLG